MLTLPEMHTLLQRISYPATPRELADELRELQAPEEAIERVRTLPEHRYGSVDSVMDALRGME
ncbi:MAG: DUF2795 domain-containing protein [Armatimonadota bacterium]